MKGKTKGGLKKMVYEMPVLALIALAFVLSAGWELLKFAVKKAAKR